VDSRPYFIVPILNTLNLEGQVSVFISPRNRVAQIHPRELGSLPVASYDPQGGILSSLHKGKYFTEKENRRIFVFVYGIYVAEGAEICFPLA
jgi:hypothetical protein